MQLVCSDGFAGVERYVSKTAAGLARAGVRVTVIGGDPASMRAALGTAVDFIPAASMAEARAALADVHGADVVNTHMTEADVVGARGRHGARHVSTRHFAARRGSSPASRAAAWFVRRGLAAQIAISQFVADAVDGPAVVIPTGVDDDDARADGDRGRTVLVAQRLEVEKHTDVALRAWARSRASAAGWQLHVAGDGSQRAVLEQLARDLDIAGSVQFLGQRRDVGELMASAGVMIAPTPREGLGLSVLEAMARALPVVACAAGGHLETVGSVADAALFAPDDAESAARALDRLIDDPVRRMAYGTRLQERQRAHFTVRRQIEQTLDVYRNAVR